MRPISELRQDLEVGKSLGDIVDVLKSASLMQFRSFQLRLDLNQAYAKELKECLDAVSALDLRHAYLFDRPSLPTAIVVVTSDEGFLGELNSLLVNTALDLRKKKGDEIIVLGERGARYLEEADESHVAFDGITDDMVYAGCAPLRDYLLKEYRKRFGRIVVVYPEFVSLAVQRVKRLPLLPLQPAESRAENAEEPLLEPSGVEVLQGVVEAWFSYQLFEIFWSSKQSEFSARIMHLEGSTHELGALNRQLSLEYFHQMHMVKDKVIREISASKVLLERAKRNLRKQNG
jgi:ATP synthase F1 gamma subunit